MSAVLSTQGLTKHFGSVQAVKGINLSIEQGMIYGMLGPNGSGKTTTLGMLLGTIRPTSGSYNWRGEGKDHDLRKNVGAILEGPIFYPYMTGRKNLEMVCLIKNVSYDRINEVLDWVSLSGRENHVFKTYSLGMKQRLAIAAALLTDPDVMILDEPTNGLDPEGIADMRSLIRQIASMGKTIILASHLLDEVQKVCTDFCVLRKGDLIYQGSVQEALAADQLIEVNATDRLSVIAALADWQLPHLEEDGNIIITGDGQLNPAELNQRFHERGISLGLIREFQRSLEDQFLQILKDNDEKAAGN